MEKEVTIEYDSIVLVVVGTYTKGQDGDYIHPDTCSTFDCYKVLCCEQDIIDILHTSIIDELEVEAVETLEG